MPGGLYGVWGTHMDVLPQSSLILMTLTSQGKFLYIFDRAGPECAARHHRSAAPRAAVGWRRHTADTTSRHSSALVRTGQSHARA